jgi:hypothetical protein
MNLKANIIEFIPAGGRLLARHNGTLRRAEESYTGETVMKHKIYYLFCLMSFVTFQVVAQPIRLSGTVLDKDTQTPIRGVSIHTKDNKTGTISTIHGKFSLEIPASKAGDYLYFSSVEYESDSLHISKAHSLLSIQLTSKIYTLKEVYVMPDSTLLTLLRKAYQKIPENYPDQPTRYEGFFQESAFTENDSLVELIEAVLSVYKESYQKKKEAPGQIEILKSRMKQFQDIHAGFAGGAFLAVDGDPVLQRNSFINPQKLKNYHYEFGGIKTVRGIDCYEIEFHPANKDSANVQGTILIDTETLAYVSFEINGQRKENASFSLIIKPVELKIRSIYEQKNGKWYLKQISEDMKYENRRLGGTLYSNASFVTTAIQTDSVKPVPIEKRLAWMDPIEAKTEIYNPKGWTDFDILAQENSNQLDFQFSNDEASSIFNQTLREKFSFTKAVIKIIPKLTIGCGISYNPVSFNNVNTDIRFQPNQNIPPFVFSDNLPATKTMILFQGVIGYRFNKKWRLYWQSSSGYFNKNILFEENSLGIEFRKNLNNAGYPLFFGASLLISDRSYYRDLGSYKSSNSFIYNHKKLDAQKLAFSYGVREQTIAPQLSLSKRISKFFTLEFYVNYPIAFHSETGIRIEEKDGFFLSRKSTTIPFHDNHLIIDDPEALKSSIPVNYPQAGIILYLF